MSKPVSSHPLWQRVAVGIGVPALCLAGILILLFRGSPFFCPFYAATHLYCPGCGAGRAATAMVHLDFAAAFRYNALFVIFIFPCAYYCLKQYIRFVFGKDILPWKDPDNRVGIAIAVIFVLFWALRNIPVFPFSLLAPH